MVGAVCTPSMKIKMPKSKLTGQELLVFAKLNQKSKDKRLAIRLTQEELDLLKQLHLKNGTTMSESLRRSFFKTHYHHFKGISHKVSK
jgi:hypothetical protein